MTIRLANEIREASRPVYCSACFNSQGIRHVDFDAASDRGYANEEAVKINMDDLILCENCIKEGARALGIEDSLTLKEELEDHKRKLDITHRRLKQAQRYADTMEEALQHRPKEVHIDHRKKPRKDIEEVLA